ncbi:MAG: ADP-ribosyltransferase domain-containing protein, partial [Promethearchaeia archaeon]
MKANVQAAVDEITDRIYGSYKELQDAHKGALSSSSNAKFAGDNLDGTFEGTFESEKAFHQGLDQQIGLPHLNPLQAMLDEHQNRANSDIEYTTSNYNLICTPSQELEAVYGCDPAESFPGTGTGENKRKIVHLRILLAATGCLRKERWASMIHSPTLKHLEKLLGTLVLSEEDKVHEAMVLLMQANERFSNTIKEVQAWLRSETERPGRQTDMDMLFDALTAVKGWDRAATQKSLDWGRELFKIADLCPEEVIALRLYTGPQFTQYNAVLRNFPKAMLDLMQNNTYTTTLHCINSGLIKLSRASPLTQRRVYRGSKKMRLPRQFAARDKLGHQCIVEMGFLSTTTKKDVALDYASGGAMSMLLVFERGAVNCGASLGALSFYTAEEEICFPPLCNLEAAAPPQMSVNKKGVVLEVYLQVSVNQHSDTIDALVQRRKFLHMGMLHNLQEEVTRELRPIDDMAAAIGKLDEKDASTLAGARHDLEGFAAKAREVCKGVYDAHRDTAALDFNQDEKFGELVNRGATMKRDAL